MMQICFFRMVVTSPCWMSLDYVTHRQSVTEIVHESPDAAADLAARRRFIRVPPSAIV